MAGQICQLDGGIRFHRFSKLDIGSSVQISWACNDVQTLRPPLIRFIQLGLHSFRLLLHRPLHGSLQTSFRDDCGFVLRTQHINEAVHGADSVEHTAFRYIVIWSEGFLPIGEQITTSV